MVKHKLVSFATVVALWTLVTSITNKANSHAFEVEIHTLQRLCHCESEAILSKKVSSRSPELECSYGKIFIPVTEISVAKTSPASHMNTSKFLRRKEWRGEISETEPALLTGLIRRSPRLEGKTCCKWEFVNIRRFSFLYIWTCL